VTVELSVHAVREELQRARGSRAAGIGEPATLLLGTIFHHTFADLVGADPERSGLSVIADGQGDDVRRLEQLESHAWTRLLAPRLLRHSAVLQDASRQVCTCWHATRALCRWLDSVVSELLAHHPEAQGSWEHLRDVLRAEVPLECEIVQPGWLEPVRLVGIADSVLHLPRRASYCAIELKLGRAEPVVDLGQAVLYHIILRRSGPVAARSALSLVRFSPEVEDHVVKGDALVEAEARLLELIGRLAGVVADLAPAPTGSGSRTGEAQAAEASLLDLGKRLKRAYREQGVGIELRGKPLAGPRFVRFEVHLTPGMRIDGLRKRTREVQLRLELCREPLVVEDAGRLYVDLARSDPQTVLFSTIEPQLPELDALCGSASVPIGVDAAGHLHCADLGSSGRSHVLLAGTTGSGKSEWLRTALAGLMARNTPDTLRIVTLDPKLAAFSDLERSKFLWKPEAWWIPGNELAPSELFHDLVEEMDRRYLLIRESGSDHLSEHVRKTGRPLARIVCICDEYFALVAQQKAEQTAIELAVGLLGAKGRAAGVHLVLATQQPSRKIITGAIQANLPCRVALYLQSQIESTMILGQGGAERLTGSGDLLYKDFGSPMRLQAPYLPPEQRSRWLGA